MSGATLRTALRRALLALLVIYPAIVIPTEQAGARKPQPLPAEAGEADVPASTWVYENLGKSQVDALLTMHGARPIDVEVSVKTGTVRYTVTMVADTGVNGTGAWSWTGGTKVKDLLSLLQKTGSRIVDLQPYPAGANVLYAAILVENTGKQARNWWWLDSATPAAITTHLKEKNARIVDIETHPTPGRFSVVTVDNSAQEAREWQWWYGQTAQQVESKRKSFEGRITAVAAEPGGRYAFVMTREEASLRRAFFDVSDAAKVISISEQFGGRVLDLEQGPNGKFSVILAENRSAHERRVLDLFLAPQVTASGSRSSVGMYLRETGVTTAEFSLLSNRAFEPASSIKVLHGLALLREIASSATKLEDSATFYNYPNSQSAKDPSIAAKDYCPKPGDEEPENAMSTTLMNVYRTMMRESDNRTTRALTLRYGIGTLNQLATSVGMTATVLEQDLIGCGWDDGKKNATSLEDLAALYDGVHAKKFLAETDGAWLAFWDHAAVTGASAALAAVVSEEAAAIGAGADAVDAFLGSYAVRGKGGSYNIVCKGLHAACKSKKDLLIFRSNSGRMCMPEFKKKQAVCRYYLTGFFMDGLLVTAGTDVNPYLDAWEKAHAELVRPLVRRSLSTWGAGDPAPTTTTVAPTRSTVAPTTTTVAPTRSTVAPTTTTVAPTRSTVCPVRVRC